MSTNISGQKREALISEIFEIKSFIEQNAKDENAAQLISYLGDLFREVNGKKYGLVFEEHREKIDEILEQNAPVFTEEKDLFIDGGGELNFLLEGDNLASLKLLEKTHRGKIDVIYIDPPYNTGNKDFIYDDDYVNEEDSFKHSKWLSFMKKRLEIAKDLLTKEGCILLSIDKNEGFQLKILLDEIFGEEALAADLHVETSVIAGPRRFAAINGSVVKTTEFILGYTKGNSKKVIKHPMYDYIPGFDSHYSLFWDSDKNTFIDFVEILKSNPKIIDIFNDLNLRISLKNLGKAISINDELKNWLYSTEIAQNLFREGDEEGNIPTDLVQSYAPETLIEYENALYRITSDKKANVLFRYSDRIGNCDDYFKNVGERSIRGNLWKGFSADGGNLAKEGGISFKNGKKPKRLIKQIIQTISGSEEMKNCTVLDFFAGSGTTGESVLELNEEDGGRRKFILCTNNENNICRDITYQRMKTVITGIRKDGSKYSDGLPGSLKYFKTDFIPISEKMYYEYADELLLHIRELVELENAVNFDKDNSVAIVLDDEELEDVITKIAGSSPTTTEGCIKTLYMGHDVLLSSKQERILKAHNITVNVIPDYYYRDLAL